jgi:hypothetical protein
MFFCAFAERLLRDGPKIAGNFPAYNSELVPGDQGNVRVRRAVNSCRARRVDADALKAHLRMQVFTQITQTALPLLSLY